MKKKEMVGHGSDGFSIKLGASYTLGLLFGEQDNFDTSKKLDLITAMVALSDYQHIV